MEYQFVYFRFRDSFFFFSGHSTLHRFGCVDRFFVVTNDGSMIPEEAPVVGMRSRIMTRVERYICADIALPSEDERTLRLAEFRKGKSVASSFVKFAKLLVHEYVSGTNTARCFALIFYQNLIVVSENRLVCAQVGCLFTRC
jgi:hypothetical protein